MSILTGGLLVWLMSGAGFFVILCAVVCMVSAFVMGYSLRMNGEWPWLNELRRWEYAKVWDGLSKTPEMAEAAATGFTGESELRKSGAIVAERIAIATAMRKTEDVLEIGCGVGRVGWSIAPRCRSWIGCDISANMLSHAKRRLDGIPNIRLVHLDQSGLSAIRDSSIDIVYCTNALPHFDQLERWCYIAEAYRVLRPTGRLYIDTIALDSTEGWSMVMNGWAQRRRGINPPYAPVPSTPDELSTFYGRAGFTIARLESHELLTLVGVKA
jgi:SAM-dependent methyltransferase